MCIRDSGGTEPVVDVHHREAAGTGIEHAEQRGNASQIGSCLLYTSDAADERSSVDLGGRRIIKKKKNEYVNKRVAHQRAKTKGRWTPYT